MKGRLSRHSRTHDQLLILPTAPFVLGDTDADARPLSPTLSLPDPVRAYEKALTLTPRRLTMGGRFAQIRKNRLNWSEILIFPSPGVTLKK